MIPILPVSGVPDELIRVLNARLRELETAIPAAATEPAPAPAASDRYTRVTSRDPGVGAVAESPFTDDGTNVTATNRVLKVVQAIAGAVQPTVMLDDTTTAKVRSTRISPGARYDVLVNLTYDGVNFNLDDTTKPGLRFTLHETIGFRVTYYPAGANPRNAAAVNTFLADNTGNADIPGVLKVAGTQVVAARQADPGVVAAAPAVSTSLTAQVADGAYSANEQQMLNELKTSLGNVNTSLLSLETQVNNLRTDRNNLRAVLQAHGLMA